MTKFVAGVDIGSRTTKALITDERREIISYSILMSGASHEKAAQAAMEAALEDAGLNFDDLGYIVSTGYGRARSRFSNSEITEISCHARGANRLFPEVHTVIDIGGQDSKVIGVGDKGQVLRFVMNDKCAAGTGRFLEVMAQALEIELGEMSDLASRSRNEVEVSSMCTVFAESEVISLIASGCDKADIAAALYRAIARRIVGMVGQVGLKQRLVMTGGVAKSQGMVKALAQKLETTILVPPDPQIVGALGAALFALERLTSQSLVG